MSSAAAKRKARPEAAVPPPSVQLVSIDSIDPHPGNRDATVDLAPLVESIRTYGVQSPVKLRPRSGRFEIVFGERRFRACRELGLPSIPATVEDLTDEAAEERRVIENTQRHDPHALEEAEAYERLLAQRDRKGRPLHTPESVARVAGRSVTHVYHRLKLTALAPELRRAFHAGDLSVTGAFAIARAIPTALQAEAGERLKVYARDEAAEEDLDDHGRLGHRAIERIIEAEYTSRFTGAPFDVDDATLVPAAGACATCPKRSSNQPQLFPEEDDRDVCTDLACWRAKSVAAVEREKQAVQAVGGRVLTDEESRRAFQGGAALPWNSRLIDLDAICYDHPARPTWRALLGDLCPVPLLAFTSQGRPRLLADRAEALVTLAANGVELGPRPRAADEEGASAVAGSTADGSADPATGLGVDRAGSRTDPKVAAERARRLHQRVLAAVLSAAENAAGGDDRLMRLVLETILHGGYHNVIIEVAKRRWGALGKGVQAATVLATRGAELTGGQLSALVLELCLGRGGAYTMSGDRLPRDLARAAAAYAIDVEAMAIVDDDGPHAGSVAMNGSARG